MKPVKQSFIIPTVFSYSSIFIWAYPVFFLYLILSGIIRMKVEGLTLASVDFLKLFSSSSLNSAILSPALALSVAAASLMIFIPTFLALRKLNAFLKNVLLGQPFTGENGEYLKFIGAVTILITIALSLKDVFLRPYSPQLSGTLNTAAKTSMLIGILFNPYLIPGMFSLVMGEVISRGAEMKDELDLTV